MLVLLLVLLVLVLVLLLRRRPLLLVLLVLLLTGKRAPVLRHPAVLLTPSAQRQLPAAHRHWHRPPCLTLGSNLAMASGC